MTKNQKILTNAMKVGYTIDGSTMEPELEQAMDNPEPIVLEALDSIILSLEAQGVIFPADAQ